jgi:hypothetical protein
LWSKLQHGKGKRSEGHQIHMILRAIPFCHQSSLSTADHPLNSISSLA